MLPQNGSIFFTLKKSPPTRLPDEWGLLFFYIFNYCEITENVFVAVAPVESVTTTLTS